MLVALNLILLQPFKLITEQNLASLHNKCKKYASSHDFLAETDHSIIKIELPAMFPFYLGLPAQHIKL
jgi:hypothetical protein